MTVPGRSNLSLLGRWLRARVRIQLRTGRAVVFTFAFPLVLIVLFNGLNGNAKVDAVGAAGQVPFAQFYTPSIGIFSLTTACYTSVILGISTARDSGLLKRVRGTPLPMPIAQLTFLPISFISGIWFPLEGAPDWLTRLAKAFPLEHIVHAFDRCFSPGVTGGGWSPDDLWSIAAWTAVGLLVATRRFRAEAAAPDRPRGRRALRRLTAGS
jgi:hypothetical protein